MKQLLKEFAAYHVWANQQLTTFILALDQDAWTRTIPSSFPSLHKTLLHMWDADSIWWQRLQNSKPINVPSKNFQGTTSELVRELLVQDILWLDYINALPEEAMLKHFTYTNMKGEEFGQPLYQVLTHLFNHGTYHRGQLVTMLRNLDLQKLPQTDFVHWVRML